MLNVRLANNFSSSAQMAFLFIIFFLTSFISLPAIAETTPDSVTVETPGPTELHPEALEELEFPKEESVVTSIRHEQPISQSPSDIYVITDEDIRQSGAIGIPTILRRVPGTSVMQPTGADFKEHPLGQTNAT